VRITQRCLVGLPSPSLRSPPIAIDIDARHPLCYPQLRETVARDPSVRCARYFLCGCPSTTEHCTAYGYFLVAGRAKNRDGRKCGGVMSTVLLYSQTQRDCEVPSMGAQHRMVGRAAYQRETQRDCEVPSMGAQHRMVGRAAYQRETQRDCEVPSMGAQHRMVGRAAYQRVCAHA
jgi:hypothetical protein